MIAGSWRAICLRGLSSGPSQLAPYSTQAAPKIRFHFSKGKQSSRDRAVIAHDLRQEFIPRATIRPVRARITNPSVQAIRSLRRRQAVQIEAQHARLSWRANPTPVANHNPSRKHQCRKPRRRLFARTQYIKPGASRRRSDGPLKRVQSSWTTQCPKRRKRNQHTPSNVIWTHKATVKKRHLSLDLRRRYPSHLWHLVAKAVPRWFSDSDHIYSYFEESQGRLPAELPTGFLQFEKFVNLHHPSRYATYQAWLARSWRGKAIWWRHALYFALLYSPLNAIRIVADISRRSYLQIPGRVIADVLLQLDAHYVITRVYDDVNDANTLKIFSFHEAICAYLENYTKREGKAILPWCIIRRQSQALDVRRLRKLVKLVQASKTEYHLYTKLAAIHKFLEQDCLDDALKLFRTLNHDELRNRATQSCCVVMLRLPWQVEDLTSLRRSLLSFMLRQGIRPGPALRNVVLQNFLESGEQEQAWSALTAIRKIPLLKRTEHTYALFLKHTSLGDSDTINVLFRMAAEDGLLSQSAYLAGYFIQVAISGRIAAKENSFDAVLILFRSLFDTTDLEELGLVAPSEEFGRLLKPSSFALQWMLMSWIHENSNQPEKLAAVYNNYQFHLRNNHPRISLLASSPHLGTSFVLAFGQHKSQLHMCSKVIQDMLQPDKPRPVPSDADPDLPAHETFLEPEDPNEIDLQPMNLRKPKLPQAVPDYEKFLEPEDPSEVKTQIDSASTRSTQNWYKGIDDIIPLSESLRRKPFAYDIVPPGQSTWNAFLSVLLRHQEVQAAESVLDAMRVAGHQPDQITWNTVLKSFASYTEDLRDKIHLSDPRDSKVKSKSEMLNRLVGPRQGSSLLERYMARINAKDLSPEGEDAGPQGDPGEESELDELDKKARGLLPDGIAAEIESRL